MIDQHSAAVAAAADQEAGVCIQ